MDCGTSYLNPERSKLLAEHLKKATGIGCKTPLLGQPVKKVGLAIGMWGIEGVFHF